MRYQEAEERPRILEELGRKLQSYATIAGEYRNKVSNFTSKEVDFLLSGCILEAQKMSGQLP